MPAGLIARSRAVDDEPGSGHEAGVVGGEKDDTLGDVFRHAEPADRVPRHDALAQRVDVVGAEIAGPADKGLLAHVGLDQTRMDRVDQCQVDRNPCVTRPSTDRPQPEAETIAPETQAALSCTTTSSRNSLAI
jgi:hypothetical protein